MRLAISKRILWWMNFDFEDKIVDECQHSTGFWKPWSRTHACTCIKPKETNLVHSFNHHHIHHGASRKKSKISEIMQQAVCIIQSWTRMIFCSGSAVWSFGRRHLFFDVTEYLVRTTGIGGDCRGTFLQSKIDVQNGEEGFSGGCRLVSGASSRLVASWDGWITGARPLAGIMIYKSECVRVQHDYLICVCVWCISVFCPKGILPAADKWMLTVSSNSQKSYFIFSVTQAIRVVEKADRFWNWTNHDYYNIRTA